MTNILVTGAAGFIGFHVCEHLLRKSGATIVGIDSFNDYYDSNLKEDRIAQIKNHKDFKLVRLDLIDDVGVDKLFRDNEFDVVIHLAAQPGVRYSMINPRAYINSNLVGFGNILEGCRHAQVKHLVFASSSSVYGANTCVPFSTHHNVDHPISLYAATKKSNELMAHTYSHLYNLPVTGLRFFTVYGPWGRPDMAVYLFTKAILEGKPIKVFNYGKQQRDFTYVDDIVEGIVRIAKQPAQPNNKWSGGKPDPSSSKAPYKIHNIGNNQPVELMHLIEVLEACLGKQAQKEFLPSQPGDLEVTYADITDLVDAIDFKPSTSIEEGVSQFVKWYRSYYQV
jgi:UDP-glucuronate 4-epimerase